MKPAFIFLIISACGSATYHLSQKALNGATNAQPMLILNLIYGAAWLMTLLLIPFFGRISVQEMHQILLDWKVWTVAFGTMLVELGFVLAYHSGGSVQWSGVAVGGMAALLLLPVGLLVFHEPFSWTKFMGILLTLSGLYFLMKK
ncbi:hypothetical protein [Wielerella bovis]|uniref:hypothetical protein n=1 Tax=Wielerella bovis TaxID=2917790 RepID=UPI002018BCE6|nr:hypothetical protein [Wielerella bovis]ULJ61371.1 hypothetical protein MIS44_05885 [Wielerella bovis]